VIRRHRPVAAAVEAHPHIVARPHRDRRRTEHAEARDGQQARRQHPHQIPQLAPQRVDLHCQLPAVGDQVPGDTRDRAGDGALVSWSSRYDCDAADEAAVLAQVRDGVLRPGLAALAARFAEATVAA
jgi:hypothetical protein